MNSETFRYKRGANQTFCQSTHLVEPAKFPEEEVSVSHHFNPFFLLMKVHLPGYMLQTLVIKLLSGYWLSYDLAEDRKSSVNHEFPRVCFIFQPFNI